MKNATEQSASDEAVSNSRAHHDEHAHEEQNGTNCAEMNDEECVTLDDDGDSNNNNNNDDERSSAMRAGNEKLTVSNAPHTDTVSSLDVVCTGEREEEEDGYVAGASEYASMSTCHEQYTTEHDSSSSAIEPCKSPSSETLQESAATEEHDQAVHNCNQQKPEQQENIHAVCHADVGHCEADRDERDMVCSVSRDLNSRVDPELNALQDWTSLHQHHSHNTQHMDQHAEGFLISTSCGGREGEQNVPLQRTYQVYPPPSRSHGHSTTIDVDSMSQDIHAHKTHPIDITKKDEDDANANCAAATAAPCGRIGLTHEDENHYHGKDERVVLTTEQTSQASSQNDLHENLNQQEQQQQQHQMTLHEVCSEHTEKTDNITAVSEHSTTTATTSTHPHRHLNPDELSRLRVSSSKGKTPTASHVSMSNTNNNCHRILRKDEIDHMMAIKQQKQQQSSASTVSGNMTTAVDEHARRCTESHSEAQRSMAPCASDSHAVPHTSQHIASASKAANITSDRDAKIHSNRVHSASLTATNAAAAAGGKSNKSSDNNDVDNACHASPTMSLHQSTSNTKRLSRRQQSQQQQQQKQKHRQKQQQQQQQDNSSMNSFNAKTGTENASYHSQNHAPRATAAAAHTLVSQSGGVQRAGLRTSSMGEGASMGASFMQQSTRSSVEHNNSDSNQNRVNAYLPQSHSCNNSNSNNVPYITPACTGNQPLTSTTTSNAPFRYPQSHFAQQQQQEGGRDRAALSGQFYGNYYNEQQQQQQSQLTRSQYNASSALHVPQNMSLPQSVANYTNNNGNMNNNNINMNSNIAPTSYDQARQYNSSKNNIACDNYYYNNNNAVGHVNSYTSFQCRGPAAAVRNDFSYAMPSSASWMQNNMNPYGRPSRGYNRSYPGAEGMDGRNDNTHNTWSNNINHNNKLYSNVNGNSSQSNNCVNNMNSSHNNGNMFAGANAPVESTMMAPQYSQWKQYSNYMAYCHQIFQQQLYQQQQQQNFFKNMVIFATDMKEEGVPSANTPAAVAAATASIAVGGGANVGMNSTVSPNMFADRLPLHPPMAHPGGNRNDHSTPHTNAYSKGGWNVMNENEISHTVNVDPNDNGNFFIKNTDSHGVEKNMSAKGKSRKHPVHQLRSSHDNTPQNKKYSQCDPFSMYKHNKALEQEVTHTEQEVK